MITYEKKTVIENAQLCHMAYEPEFISGDILGGKWAQMGLPQLVPPEAHKPDDVEYQGPEGTFEIVVRFTPKEKET